MRAGLNTISVIDGVTYLNNLMELRCLDLAVRIKYSAGRSSAFLMGFPIMYMMMEGAVEHLEEEMNQMCYLYGFTTNQKIRHYIIPTLSKSFSLGAKQTLSMVWKVVVAAEVLTIPKYGVGSKMQFAQIQLETAEVLAWTLIAVLLSAIGDLIFHLIESSIKMIVRKIKEKIAE